MKQNNQIWMWNWIINSFFGSLAANIAIILLTSALGYILYFYKDIWKRFILAHRLSKMGISNIFANRNDYIRYRKNGDYTSFLSQANKQIIIIGHWMAYATENDEVVKNIIEFVRPPKCLSVKIALLNPKGITIPSFAQYIGLTEAETIYRISQSLIKLTEAKSTLNDEEKSRIDILIYDTFPSASVIMLDPDESKGLIQVDFKLYQQSRKNSFTFEVSGQTPLYERFRESWKKVVDEAKIFNPKKDLPISKKTI